MGQAPFFFRDGERVMRFGAAVEEEAAGLLDTFGFGGEWVLLTTERAEPGVPAAVRERAADTLYVASGPVAPAAAALMDAVAGRDVVAYGGGRVVDAAKAVTAAGGGKVAAIPTTLAGSTFTPFHRLPEGHEGHPMVRPALAVCEPALMTSAPRQTLVATAMNALAHGVEALYGPLANPVAEGAALRGAPLIVGALESDSPDPDDLALGALLCGYAVGVAAGLVIHHATCQSTVAVLGTPHAQTNAVMLPRSIAFMADRAPDQLGRLADALGVDSIQAAADRIGAVAAGAGPSTLADLGVEAADLDAVVDAIAAHPGLAATPGEPGREGTRALLESAGPG